MSKPGGDERVEALVDLVSSSDSILNAGCAANPDLHAQLCGKSQHVVGIDIDKPRLEALLREGYDVRCMDAEHMALDEPVDCIIAGELIEHLNDVGSFLRSASQCLRPGGRLIITTPNIASVFLYTLVVMCEKPQDPTHVYHFDRPSLISLFKRHPDFHTEAIRFIPPSVKGMGKGIIRPIFFLATWLANIGFRLSPRLFGSYILVVLRKQ